MTNDPPQAWIFGFILAAHKRGETETTVADAIEWWNLQAYLEARHDHT